MQSENNKSNKKKLDSFTYLKKAFPSEQLNFKEYYWEKEKDHVMKNLYILYKKNLIQLFTEDKIQFDYKEKNLLKSLLLKEIPSELRKNVNNK